MATTIGRRSSSPRIICWAGCDRERADLPTAVDEQWERRHQTFHEALIAACQSKVLLGFCHQLFARANRYRRLSITVPDIPRDIRTEHRRS